VSASIIINGTDRTSNLVRLELREEYCDPGKHFEAMFDSMFVVSTWETVAIYEGATLLFTGSTSQIEGNRPDGSMVVRGGDDIKRLREYFVVEEYTAMGEGVKHWIAKFAQEAGCTISFLEDYDPIPLEGMTLGRMPAWEIISELLLYARWDIWCGTDGTVLVGRRMQSGSATETIAAGDNLVSMDRSLDSEPPRNAAIVYAATGYAKAQQTFGWEIDSNDVRTMVVSSMYVKTPVEAADLAHQLIAAGGPTYDIKRCELDDVYPGIEIGDVASFDNGKDDSGEDMVTSVTSTWDGVSGERRMHVKLGERCPLVGAGGGSPVDGRDVIVATYSHGVWRCKDIWEGTPHWEPLNTGLRTAYPDYGIPADGGLSCDWFIRDPFECNTRAFLQTKYAIYETQSLEPGYENWVPVLPYKNINPYPETNRSYYVLKLRSTIARRGRYYIVVGHEGDEFGQWDKYIMGTNDHFRTIFGRRTYNEAVYVADVPMLSHLYPMSSAIFGDPDYEQQESVGMSSWHHLSRYCEAGKGGLAAWHRNDHGCFMTGTKNMLQSGTVISGAGPAIWSGVMWTEPYYHEHTGEYFPADEIIVTPIHSLNPMPNPNWWRIKEPYYLSSFEYNPAANWYKHPSIHIPYDQQYKPYFSWPLQDSANPDLYRTRQMPSVYYAIPGVWEGDIVFNTGSYPWHSIKGKIGNMPWGGTDCHFLQGALGTYTPNRNKVYCFNAGKPSRFAISDDECDSWTEKASVPFRTACFSGFPYSSNKVYVGRDPTRDATGAASADDTALLYSSWDRGDTWTDVTGDLWTQTQDMHIRSGGFGVPYYGAHGLVTVAPRYV